MKEKIKYSHWIINFWLGAALVSGLNIILNILKKDQLPYNIVILMFSILVLIISIRLLIKKRRKAKEQVI